MSKSPVSDQNNIQMSELSLNNDKNKLLSPVYRSISIGSSAALFDSNSASHRKSLDAAVSSNNGNTSETSYRTKDTRKSSVVYDKIITKRRVSQVKLSGQLTSDSFDCEH